MEPMPSPAVGPRVDAPAVDLSPRAKLEILGAILLGLFLGALDQTIVGTALPRIVTELRGLELYTWVTTAYLLTSTITVPFYGKLSDLYGRKPIFIAGIAIFLLGSFLSGLSQEMWQLVLFRGVQGLGAGSLFPIALAVIGDLYTPAERGRYQGLFGAVFGVSALIGPALGGFLTEAISWHWIFFVNLPLGAVSLYVIWRILPTVRRADASRTFDFLGAGVFGVGVTALLLGLTNRQGADWSDPLVGGLIGLGLVVLGVFLWIETRVAEPIIPPDLWRDRTYATSMVAVFLISFGFFGAIIFMPLWFQAVQGASPTESGYQALPLLLGLILSSIVSGVLVSRTGRYKPILLVALAVMATGLALMTQLRATTDLPIVWAWMFVTGLGIGPTLSVFTIVVQNAVPFGRLGVATSNLTFFRQIGGSVGLAIVGAIFGSSLRDEAPRQLVAAGLPGPVVTGFAGGFDTDQLTAVGGDLGASILASVPAALRPVVEPLVPSIVSAVHEAISISIAQTFWLGLAATIAALAVTVVLPELRLRTTHGPAVEPGPEAEREGDRRSEPLPRLAEAPVRVD